MLYHAVLHVRGEIEAEVRLDLDRDMLERQFLQPYRLSQDLIVHGRSVPRSQIKRLQVFRSETPSRELRRRLRARDLALKRSPTQPEALRVAHAAEDVTDELVEVLQMPEPKPGTADPRAVFLVHGRWTAAVQAMRQLLQALDLRVIDWNEAVDATNKPNPFIAEILDAGFSLAHVTVVLMTPDDVACLHPRLWSKSEPDRIAGQPRPNVIFEAGMAWQMKRERTLLVQYGKLRGFTDLSGVYMVRLDNTGGTRKALADRLKNMGADVHDDGTDWLSAGRFPKQLPPPTALELGLT